MFSTEFTRGGLTEIYFPTSVTYIGESFCARCPDIRAVILPAALKQLGGEAFYTNWIEYVAVPLGIQSVVNGGLCFGGGWQKVCADAPSSLDLTMDYSAYWKLYLGDWSKCTHPAITPATVGSLKTGKLVYGDTDAALYNSMVLVTPENPILSRLGILLVLVLLSIYYYNT